MLAYSRMYAGVLLAGLTVPVCAWVIQSRHKLSGKLGNMRIGSLHPFVFGPCLVGEPNGRDNLIARSRTLFAVDPLLKPSKRVKGIAETEMQKHLDAANESSKRTFAIEQKVTLVQLRVQQLGDNKGLLPSSLSTNVDRQTITEPSGQLHVALVSEVKEVNITELTRVTAALQKQVANDLGPFWNINCDRRSFPIARTRPKWLLANHHTE